MPRIIKVTLAAFLISAFILMMMVSVVRVAPGGDVAYAQETCGDAVTGVSTEGPWWDCNALLAARDTLRGTAALNWAPDTPITQWDGITLSEASRVTKIKLQKRGLNGQIPAELGRLDRLQELWLYSNDLSGSIPPELGALPDLRWLFVSSNKLRGQIPGTLNNLALDRLWLHKNSFTGCVPYSLTLTREYKVDRDLPACASPGNATPDASRIAFYSKGQIYVMNTDGSGQTRLTNDPEGSRHPSWSPGGHRIAFTSNQGGANSEIHVMNADGSDQTRLTYNSVRDRHPSWSPDGHRIAFESDRDGNTEIYVMNADGSGQTRLTYNPASSDYHPSWSPDGSRIAFASNQGGRPEIYVMNADGSSRTRLTYNPAYDDEPSWSPDGRRIAFSSNRDGWNPARHSWNYEIYVMNADGSGQTRLTYSLATDQHPSWSPDGRRIAFSSNRDRWNYEIYVMNADGPGWTRPTYGGGEDPSWSPVLDGPGPAQTPTPPPSPSNTDARLLVIESRLDDIERRLASLEATVAGLRGTPAPSTTALPTATPDGRHITFTSNRGGDSDAHVMDEDGSGQTLPDR